MSPDNPYPFGEGVQPILQKVCDKDECKDEMSGTE